jgi:hypothetical protein
MVGAERSILVALSVLFLALLACGGADTDALLDRAAFELRCPKDEIQMRYLDDKTMGVVGCGHRLVYVQACRGAYAAECQWVLNSDSRDR